MKRLWNQVHRHIAFIQKIDLRFHQRQSLDQAAPPFVGPIPQQTLQLAHGLAPLRFRFGADQIRQSLHAGQIEFSIFECAPGELTRFRRPQPTDRRKRLESCRNHRPAAVNLKFGNILTGLAGGPRKPQRQRLVDRFSPGRIARKRPLPFAAPASSSAITALSAAPARGPEIRITAIAAGGWPDEKAKMVCSRGCIGLFVPETLKRQRNYHPSRLAPITEA